MLGATIPDVEVPVTPNVQLCKPILTDNPLTRLVFVTAGFFQATRHFSRVIRYFLNPLDFQAVIAILKPA